MEEYRIFGPPGTGKTRFLSDQVQAFINRDGFSPNSIYIASFTKAAAKEIASRNELIPESNVGTLHALCFRLLERPRIAESKINEFDLWTKDDSFRFKATPRADVDDPLSEEMVNFNRSTNGNSILSLVNFKRNQMIPIGEWNIGEQRFFKEWGLWKDENGYLDFTDLLEIVIKDLIMLPRAEILMVDEAQDMTPIHWRLVDLWKQGVTHYLVAGDDDQAIYGWMGAKVSKFLSYGPEVKVKVLSKSHRMPRSIHTLSQAWIKGVSNRKDKQFEPMDNEGYVEFSNHSYATKYPTLVGDETIMFLASTNQFLTKCIEQCRKIGIPFHNPYRKNNGAWNPLARRKNTMSAVDRLRNFLKENQTASEFLTWAECLLKKCYDKDTMEFVKTLPKDHVLTESDYDQMFGDLGERLFTKDTEILYSNLLAKYSKAFEYPLAIYHRDYDVEDLLRTPTLIIGTIHSVKGGEADHVIVAPDLSGPAYVNWCRGDRDEIYRIFYVAFTRAKQSLTILRPYSKMAIPVPIV